MYCLIVQQQYSVIGNLAHFTLKVLPNDTFRKVEYEFWTMLGAPDQMLALKLNSYYVCGVVFILAGLCPVIWGMYKMRMIYSEY